MKPGKYDLPTIWRGCTYPIITFQWKLADGTPINLTGWTPHAKTRNIDLNPTVTNAALGLTSISLTKVQTAGLRLGTEAWDWIFSNNGSTTPPLLAGQVTIKEPNTKED